MRTDILLQNILDFIGAEGVVDDAYELKLNDLCRQIREKLQELQNDTPAVH